MDIANVYSLLESFSDNTVSISTNAKTGVVTIKDPSKEERGTYQLRVFLVGSHIRVKPYNEMAVNDTHMATIINDRHKLITTDQQICDMIETIREAVPNVYNYCVGCLKKTEFQGDTFITCGNPECDYKYEELHIGNPVTEKCKADQEICRFLIESAFDAIQCPNKLNIFEPFPRYFMKGAEGTKVERGNMSKLTGNNIDHLKDFDRLDIVIKKVNLDKFFELITYCKDDAEIIKMVGLDQYTLIRFILLSAKVTIVKEEHLLENGPKTCYKIMHPATKEQEFERLKADKQTSYLFHGSKWHNWFSIMRNGLKNCSKTALMTTGAAYGPGIYLSDSFDFCCGYGLSTGKSNDGLSSNHYVVGVFEVLGSKEEYRKSGPIFVVADETKLIQRYLLLIPSTRKGTAGTEISAKFCSEIQKEEVKTKSLVMTKGIKRLIAEYKKIVKLDLKTLGIRVVVDNEDLYKWSVYVSNFDKEYPIYQDMVTYGVTEIEFEMLFPPYELFSLGSFI